MLLPKWCWIAGIVMISVLAGTPRALAGDDLSHLSDLSPSDFETRLKALARSEPWQRLISSNVAQPGFLLAPQGRVDFELEMRRDLEAFRDRRLIGHPALAAQCAFPERYRFLKSQLQLNLSDVPCPELEKFLDTFHAKGVSLVFSSAYPNNPGSMFGHTFLRFRTTRVSDLLDGTISFAAAVGEEQDLLFMFKGIFGGYQGHFTAVPYYVKINEYNNAESRDLVEYVLSFDENETLSLLRHFWEIEHNSWIPYYFLDENCGSVLIDALEAARPGLKIPHPKLYSIPTEVTRAIASVPGLVKRIQFRPSLRRKLVELTRQLRPPQKAAFRRIVAGELTANETHDVDVLDSTNLYFQYLKQKQESHLSPNDTKRTTEFLIQRSQLAEPSHLALLEVSGERESRPDFAHHASSLMGDGGVLSGSAFQELQIRTALQGLIDHDEGYVPFSEFEFPEATLRWYSRVRKLRLQHLNFVSITSLSPMNDFERRPSWRAAVDIRSPQDLGVAANPVAHAEGGIGGTVEWAHSRWWTYTFIEGYGEMGPALRKGYRFGPLVNFGSVAKLSQVYEVNFNLKALSDLFQVNRSPVLFELNLDQDWAIAQDWKGILNASWVVPSRADESSSVELKTGVALFF